MLSPYDFSSAIIADLKADAALVAALTDASKIKEQFWMGDEFTYPAVRVEIPTINTQQLNGNCKGQWFDINFSIYVFVEGVSSRVCQTMMGIIGTRYQNRSFVTASVFKTQPLSVNYITPASIGQNFWRGEVVVFGAAKELI